MIAYQKICVFAALCRMSQNTSLGDIGESQCVQRMQKNLMSTPGKYASQHSIVGEDS